MNKDFEKLSMEDVDYRFPRGRNSSNISGLPVRTEAESLNEKKSNLGTNEEHNDKDETQNCSSRSQAPSTSKALCPEKLARIYETFRRMISIIEIEHLFTIGLLEKFKLQEIKYIMTDEEFALKYVEYERVRALSRLFIKTIQRCRKLQKCYLSYILDGVEYYSSKMNLKRLKDVTNYMHQNFHSLQMIHHLISLVYQTDNILNTYSIALAEAQSEYKNLRKWKKCEKDSSPESIQDLITPSDHDIAITLTNLLNFSEDFLLPILREFGVIPSNNESVITYACEDDPDSLREHMALLEAILSHSNDLVYYQEEPVDNLYNCLSKVEDIMKRSIYTHKHLAYKYRNSSINVRNINTITLSVTQEKSNQLNSHYNRTRCQHNEVMRNIHKLKGLDRKQLKLVSEFLLKFCDATNMANKFIAILNVFAWLTTVSAKYCEFIELDQIYLDTYLKIISKLRIVE